MRQARLYLGIMVPLLVAITVVLLTGIHQIPSKHSDVLPRVSYSLISVLEHEFHNPLSTVLLQLIIILFAAKGLGWVFARIGQQSVMGEITAGILLGPSFLGWLFPDVFHTLFPVASLTYLGILSQLGLLLFMFVIGMELDIDTLRSQMGRSLVISHGSIAMPFLFGAAFAFISYTKFGNESSGFMAYALFMGIALSITAFPVLARILKERGMTATPLGALALICAAINDVTAWCILPVVVAITKAESLRGVAVTIILTIVFISVMVLGVKAALQRYYQRQEAQEKKGGIEFIAIAVLLLLSSALIAEVIGIHALFGAFIAGAVLPGSKSLRHGLTERLEGVSVSLLLPIFFVLTGLRTNIGMLTDISLWPVFVCILILAVAGKLLGSAVPAMLSDLTWRQSITIGILMNTRGLMELIVLNIGYDLGVLRPEIFTMMVFMALVTTFMTAPLLNWMDRKPA